MEAKEKQKNRQANMIWVIVSIDRVIRRLKP